MHGKGVGEGQVCKELSSFIKEQERIVAPPGLGYQGEELDSAVCQAQCRREAQALLSSLREKSHGREGS